MSVLITVLMGGVLGDLGSFIMKPLYYAISAVLIGFHRLFSLVLPEDAGWTWILAITGLTIVIRAALIPLFVKQINASRNMQLLQPQVKELQKKYGHDREKLTQETMKLYKDSGTNPFASCLPILIQMPIFLALFRLLSNAAKESARGFLTPTQAHQFGEARWLGVKISESFTKANGDRGVQVMALTLVLAMLVTTFWTQRQLMTKNMPEGAMTGQFAQQQKIMLYVLPVAFAVGGIAFPIGVLVYWTVSNLWTMGQQYYVIRRNPAPGTPAFKAKQDRDRARALRHGKALPTSDEEAVVSEESKTAAREQPKRQTRAERQKKRP